MLQKVRGEREEGMSFNVTLLDDDKCVEHIKINLCIKMLKLILQLDVALFIMNVPNLKLSHTTQST